ncbi:hypothetical protein FPF71_15575 [Algibacter amylolyticus]|uniref:Uncharacterized protein n=1 Tax=Algibacter amylolyticus TaxID=1608400 RepID=A0A5M7AWV6_9FLAO|nr:hypothetical protein [Algibacter amylolyticus]KAA5821926.1 hypothetical protein F2B50_15575 [Algibacter amylolyticus]MBB5269276.1 hypothetical protein [Algibacter amylolyticus]TSJ73210.1 hypothetical protein FPF71_15575 [Algibacter amylolyticus]
MTQNTFKENINTVKEIYPGTYQIILDFASKKIIDFILRAEFEFIWIHDFEPENKSSWNKYDLPISTKLNKNVLARQISYDFLLKTAEFEQIKEEIPNGITLIQIKNKPPEFLDLKRLEGKTRYDLLKKECDYLFEINLPNAVDYGTLISSNKNYLNELLNDSKINWNDLP